MGSEGIAQIRVFFFGCRIRDSLSDEMMSLVTRDIKWLGGTTGCVGVG